MATAQLIDWHRREEKSGWWEFFRQRNLTDEERIEDPTAIGGLTYAGVVGTVARSLLHQYAFPPQDHGITLTKKVIDPATGSSLNEPHSMSDTSITLKRGKTSAVPHPTSLIVNDVVQSDLQKKALMRLGTWIAEHGFDSLLSAYATERALLRRTPPTFQATAIEGDRTQAGVTLALGISDAVLAVQGPPGAGKTYLAARMIVALVRAGKRVGILANSHKVVGKLLAEACEAAEEAGVPLRAIQKPKNKDDEPVHHCVKNVHANGDVRHSLSLGANVVGGVSWLWADEDMKDAVDVLFVDEAGQISLANVIASAQAARGLVLLGDPQQLDQPLKGVHPPGAEASALGHLLNGHATISDDKGIFLAETWRMHPDICSYISEAFYEGKLTSRPHLAQQRIHAPGPFNGTGLRLEEVPHTGNTNASTEEAAHIGKLVNNLLASNPTWTNAKGETVALTAKDIVILTPYNAQVAAIRAHVPQETAVGTVDKFQGQEAAIAIYSLATSSPEDAPRGMEFLYSKNRLNVAISRARCVAMIVASPALFQARCKTPRQMELANALCLFRELALEEPSTTE